MSEREGASRLSASEVWNCAVPEGTRTHLLQLTPGLRPGLTQMSPLARLRPPGQATLCTTVILSAPQRAKDLEAAEGASPLMWSEKRYFASRNRMGVNGIV